MLLAAFERQALTKAIWTVLPLGTWVDHHNLGKAQLVAKDISQKTGLWRLWLRAGKMSYAIDPLEINTLALHD